MENVGSGLTCCFSSLRENPGVLISQKSECYDFSPQTVCRAGADMTRCFQRDSFFFRSWVFPGSAFPEGLLRRDGAGPTDLESAVDNSRMRGARSREKLTLGEQEALEVDLGVTAAACACARGFGSVTELMFLDFWQQDGVQATSTLLRDAREIKCHNASDLLLKI